MAVSPASIKAQPGPSVFQGPEWIHGYAELRDGACQSLPAKGLYPCVRYLLATTLEEEGSIVDEPSFL